MNLASTKSVPGKTFERRADDDMVFVPGGTYRMGSGRHYPEEAPAHRVTLDGFLVDRHPVTNQQLINLHLDPFERTGWPSSGTKEGAQQYFDWFKYEF